MGFALEPMGVRVVIFTVSWRTRGLMDLGVIEKCPTKCTVGLKYGKYSIKCKLWYKNV